MKHLLSFISILFTTITLIAQQQNANPANNRIKTPWAEKVNISNPHPDYPRPQMMRSNNWWNLNGQWDYTIQPKMNKTPDFQGKILVPFAVESALSGVGKTVGKDSVLWYRRTVSMSSDKANKKVLLHFGAVDWQSDVFVNGQLAGSHQGGYDPFTLDITRHLKSGDQQEIIVRVWDPSDDGPQPRGKQVKNPRSIWYTPVTGIWQTVWLEAVPQTYISLTKQTPDIDTKTITVSARVENVQQSDKIRISAWDGKQKIAEKEIPVKTNAVLSINNPKLWSPDKPFLYDLQIALIRDGKVIDQVKSYFGMRKISMSPDAAGVQRMLLNNKFLFQYGPLDQGWWPDGLYTAPTDEALKFDIEKTKEMGFNMIRKHVKTEPARWYYYCDSIGLLVWQDMPSGDMSTGRWDSRPGIEGIAEDAKRSDTSEAIFRTEWKAIMDALYNFPSIVVWVPFNEAWGQFKTEEITKWTMQKDPSRLVNSASGGNFYPVGHIMDLHNYPAPAMPAPELFGRKQILVLGEYGGLGLPVEGHTWQQKDNWGYQSFKNKEELQNRYETFVNRLPLLIKRGLSAAIYTQTTDVEIEVNGLMTYDRKIIKIPVRILKQFHAKLYNPSLVNMKK
jgi:beta-galactosidase/beta-glucuronidase